MFRIVKNKNGITLIALVVTIIVLIILAGISISLVLGNNGIITKAKDAKENTIIGQEKEQVELAYVSAAVKKLGENVSDQDLQDELNSSVGNGKTLVAPNSDTTLNVLFYDTDHNYNVNKGVVLKVADSDIITQAPYSSKIKSVYISDNKVYMLKTTGEFVKSGHANLTKERRIWTI